MNRQKEQYRREDLKKLTSPQLDAVLCAELEKECADRDVILGILSILEEREADMPLPEDPKIIEAKIRFEAWTEGYDRGRETGRKPMRKLAGVAIAAMLILVFGVITPQALGAENIFTLIGKWTAAFFAFEEPETMPERETPQESYVFRTDNPGLQQLYDTVTELGITQRVVPQWLPEGYALEQIKVLEEPHLIKVHARFLLGTQEISITIRIVPRNTNLSYHKDETDVEIYEYGGVQHYIMGNESAVQTVWHTGNAECLLRTTNKFNLQQIIESVYGEE